LSEFVLYGEKTEEGNLEKRAKSKKQFEEKEWKRNTRSTKTGRDKRKKIVVLLLCIAVRRPDRP
jgi:hypothetical protein